MQNQSSIPPTPFLAIVIILSSYYLFIFLLLGFIPQESLETLSSQHQRYLIIFSEISFAIIPVIYLKYQNLSIWESFRINLAPKPVVLVAIPLGLGMTLLMEELLRILNMIFTPPADAGAEVEAVLLATDFSGLLLITVGLVIIAPLIEELIFRGFLQRSLEFHSTVTLAILYGSIGWAILHITPYHFAQTVPLFLYGFILGYLSYKSGSIWPSVICHAINNGMAVLSVNTGFEKDLPFFNWGDHISPFMIAVAIVLVVGSIRFIEGFYDSDALSSSVSKSDEKR